MVLRDFFFIAYLPLSFLSYKPMLRTIKRRTMHFPISLHLWRARNVAQQRMLPTKRNEKPAFSKENQGLTWKIYKSASWTSRIKREEKKVKKASPY